MTALNPELIADLPKPVRRSIERSGLVGTPIPTSVIVYQVGRIRQGPDRRWLRFTAREVYSVDAPGFSWDAALKIGPVTVGRATDSLRYGRGRMHVKVLGMFSIVDEEGPEMDQGSLLRWLNETMWFPSVWATDVISWEAVDDAVAIASVTADGLTVSAEFRFDEQGRLINFTADRFRDTDDGAVLTKWATPLRAHARFNHIELPSEGGGVWHLPDGEFEYIQLRITDIEYR